MYSNMANWILICFVSNQHSKRIQKHKQILFYIFKEHNYFKKHPWMNDKDMTNLKQMTFKCNLQLLNCWPGVWVWQVSLMCQKSMPNCFKIHSWMTELITGYNNRCTFMKYKP
jgi:hypothetical protein